MIGTLEEAQTLLDSLVEKYYSEEEYKLSLKYKDSHKSNVIELNCSTEIGDFQPETLYLPMPDFQFEEDVARVADNANWTLSPIIDPNDIEIEGLCLPKKKKLSKRS